MKKIKEWQYITISLAILIFCGLKFTCGIEKIIDITLYDESYYLQSGINLIKTGFPHADQAPLYAIWYFILSQFTTDNITLYYTNYKVMTILPAILIFLLLKKCNLPWIVSIIVPFYFLISRANLPIFIKVSHFALCVILFFLLASLYTKTPLGSIEVMTIGMLLTSYVRPEFFLSFLIFLVASIILFLKKENMTSNEYKFKYYFLFILIIASIIWILGLPISWQGKRQWVAFGQHFALNYFKWHQIDDLPWSNWVPIFKTVFGNTESVFTAFFNNPFMVMKHILYNIKEFTIVFGEISIIHYNILLPPSGKVLNIIEGVLLIITCAIMIYYFRKEIYYNIKNISKKERILSVYLLVIILPNILSAILIFPRPHYLMIMFALILVWLVIITIKVDYCISFGTMMLVGLLMIGLTPYIGSNWYFTGGYNEKKMDTINTIFFIRYFDIKKPAHLLNAEGNYSLYLGDNFVNIDIIDKKENFYKYINNKDINIIIETEGYDKDNKIKNDKEWQDFLKNYQKINFVKYDVPNSINKLYIKSDLFK